MIFQGLSIYIVSNRHVYAKKTGISPAFYFFDFNLFFINRTVKISRLVVAGFFPVALVIRVV